MIGIRVDANEQIAAGHVMGCLSIASGLKSAGIDYVFITADEKAIQIVTSNGFNVICLDSKWNDLDKKIEQFIKVIKGYKLDKLIVDNYYVTVRYLEELINHRKVIYIDDMNILRYPASMVINCNIYYGIFSYPEKYSRTETRLLLGCDYVPLREEFRSIEPSYRETIKKVLITTGGTDQFNISVKLLNRIMEQELFKDIEFHVVVGRMNSYIDSLKRLADRCNSIVLHQDVKHMSLLMKDCDIAITAGGSTMYELCACGVPSICFSFADNQLYGVKGFAKEGLMAYAGDVRDNEAMCIDNLIALTCEYIKNPQVRKQKFIKMPKKVDGKGVSRIVKAIADL